MSDIDLQHHGLHLLSLAKTIYHYEEALARASGGRFNLFDIIHVGHYEVRTHSPMLAELLNPKGSHGQGAAFLKLFLAELKIHNFDALSANVNTEVSIGEDGRLDIVITDGNRRSIFIENKIYAILQDKQLERYHCRNPKANLLFLTLNGDNPEDWETNAVYKTESFTNAFQRVSYKTNIVSWLKSCRKEAAAEPVVRETITQYIYLIQRLTHQNTNARMNNELTQAVLANKESYLAYAAMRDANFDIRRKIIEKLNADVRASLPEGLKLEQVPAGNGGKDEGYLFSTQELLDRNLMFGIVFERRDYGGCFFGFRRKDFQNLNSYIPASLEREFREEFPASSQSSKWWPAWEWLTPCDWGDEVFADIQFDPLFPAKIISLVKQLERIANQICQPIPMA